MNLDTSKPIKSVSYNGVDVPLFQEAPVLLWTNGSPTSNFNAQTLSINGAEYDGYIVEIRWNNAVNGYGCAYIPFSTTPCAVVAHRNASSGSVLDECAIREVKSASKSNIVFGNGLNGASRVELAGAGIPTRIWGVKFTL